MLLNTQSLWHLSGMSPFQTVMLGTDGSPGCWFQVSQLCYLRTGCLGFDQGWFGREADAVFSPEQTTL